MIVVYQSLISLIILVGISIKYFYQNYTLPNQD